MITKDTLTIRRLNDLTPAALAALTAITRQILADALNRPTANADHSPTAEAATNEK